MNSPVEDLWDQYNIDVRRQAIYEFVVKVKPFCNATGLEFVSKDEGCWVIPPESGSWEFSDEDADRWEDIARSIMVMVPGMDCRLCSLMPDYTPEETSE